MTFHHALAETIAALAQRLGRGHDFQAVGLSGGVFQNALLGQLTIAALQRAGLRAHLPMVVPANDGGLSLGQALEAAPLVAHAASACSAAP
jgi:hydrogenase maturation protein HypF